MGIVFVILLALVMPILLWSAYCNNKTLKQRVEIIRNCSKNAKRGVQMNDLNWKKYWSCYDNVSYDEHFLHLLTFRNPMKLYEQQNK